MMSATPKEKVQVSARLKDPIQAKQMKDLLNVNSSELNATKKRKRGSGSKKRRRMSSSMETISPESTDFKTSLNKDPKRDESATKSVMSRGLKQFESPERPRPEILLKASSEPMAVKDSASTESTNPLELLNFPPSEFIFPRELDLGLFDCSSDERETSYEPVSDSLLERHNEVPTPYTPVLRAVSQYKQRISSQRGGKCERWLARQMYDELDDISTRIEKIMRGITVMLQKGEASDDLEAGDDLEGAGGYYLEAGESSGASKGGGPENPLELSEEDDCALFVGSGERACSGESGGLSANE
ncbi:hypothetical protein PITC_041970 [Penicillium italicum]|uniref:Uncharacterized protein n=1 Tax=Penicillium italicum TaxID=40296 RepID=A0A0A2KDG1_PENIT|nr:hypothetical protein PITC_041970 [Penicillium italicum]